MNINTVRKGYMISGTDYVFSCYIVTDTDNKEHGVPLDEANTDYQAIMEFIADGGTVIDNPPEETP